MKNNTDQAITLPSKTVICQLGIANLVPKLVAPQCEYEDEEIDPDLLEDPDIDYNAFKAYAAQASDSAGDGDPKIDEPTPCTATLVEDYDGSWLLEKIDLFGIDDWPVSMQQQARELFKRYSHALSKDDLDLGRAKMVKHYIKLTDPIPFKERYRRIPPQLYDDIREHLQEMLRLGAIRKSCSPWTSAIVLVKKKHGKLRFCIDL